MSQVCALLLRTSTVPRQRDCSRDPEVHALVSLLKGKPKHKGQALKPTSSDRPACRIAQRKLAHTIGAFFDRVSPAIIEQAVAAVKRVQKSDSDDVMASIDLSVFEQLPDEVRPILRDMFEDSAQKTLLAITVAAGKSKSAPGVPIESFDQVNEDAIDYAATRAAEMVGMEYDTSGHLVPNGDAEWRIDDSTRDYIRDEVEKTLRGDISVLDLPKALEERGFSPERARTIARTEVNMANNEAALAAMKRTAGTVSQKVWLTSNDDKVSDDCEENQDAGPIGIDDDFPSGDDAPPAHANCLPGHSHVLPVGSVTGACDRWYDGEVVVIRTAGGKKLTCTPNHPVLTDTGFVPARLLNKGGNVIARREWMVAADNDHDQVPARIEDIASAFCRAPGVVAMEVPTTAEHFHGDGRGSKVAVVWTNSQLRDGANPAGLQLLRDIDFERTDVHALPLNRRGVLDLFFDRFCSAANGAVRSLYSFASLVAAHVPPLQPLRLAQVASGDSALVQSKLYRSARNAEQFGARVCRPSAEVFADEIIDINVNTFHGRVFNIETTEECYFADGILTHNCRCALAPFVTWDEEPETPEEPQE